MRVKWLKVYQPLLILLHSPPGLTAFQICLPSDRRRMTQPAFQPCRSTWISTQNFYCFKEWEYNYVDEWVRFLGGHSHLGSKILFEILTLQGYLLRKVWHPVVWTDHVDLCDSSWWKEWGVVDISRGAVHASRMVQSRGWTRIFIRVVPVAEGDY